MREFRREREGQIVRGEEVREGKVFFLERKRELRSQRESEEQRKMERNKKVKKWLVIVGKKMKRQEGI